MTKTISKTFAAGLAAIVMCAAAPSNATLIGDQIDIQNRGFTTSTFTNIATDVEVIDPGAEVTGLTHPVSTIDIDIDGSSIEITVTSFVFEIANNTVTGLLWRFLDLDWVGVPDGTVASFNIVDNDDNLLNPTSSFTTLIGPNAIQVVQNGFITGRGPDFSTETRTARIEIVANHPEQDPNPQPDPNAVPEPSALALIGLGLVGIGFTRRRRSIWST